jgi:hypothetical protein
MADVLGFRNTKGEKDGRIDTDIKPLYDEFYSKGEESEYPLIVSSTPKNWVAINEEDYQEDEFYLSEKELTSYVDGFMETIRQYGEGVYEALFNQPEELEIFSDSSLEDNDIKLSLYRSFKSLYDKWISSSDPSVAGDSVLFYNQSEGTEDRLLYDHFQFVNRGFGDIGSEAVIDISYLEKFIEQPTTTLYQSIADLLSKNNFDFFPLPSYINYRNTGKDTSKEKGSGELEKMFEPLDNLSGTEAAPSYICMFVGGSSRVLDIKNISSSCKNNKVLFEYEDDSFDITSFGELPEDISNGDLIAFKVAYGQDNQSHFKSIELDQAEYKETQESLAVIEQMAGGKEGGGTPTKATKGNNLHNVYLTRSYTCTVESLGNMMIQPLMYFKLENVPMFHGTYLIYDVKHSIKANNVSTSFKGVRQPLVTLPIVKDALSLLNLSDNELSADTERTSITSQGGSAAPAGSIKGGEATNAGTTTGSSAKQTPKIRQYSNWIDTPIDQRVPNTGASDGSKPKGLSAQKPRDNVKYGMREVIETIQNVAEKFNEYAVNQTHGEKIFYNDVSLRGGGVLDSHRSHQIGIDIDFRQIRSDKNVATFSSSFFVGVSENDTRDEFKGYSRVGTRNLIKYFLGERFRGDGGGAKLTAEVDVIYFNDPVLAKEFPKVKILKGHHNHLHVRFKVPPRVEDESSKTDSINSKPFTS